MSTYAIFENTMLAVVLLACILFALRRFTPNLWRAMLRKPPVAAQGGGCGSGCSSCGGCGSTSTQDKPLVHSPLPKQR